MKKSCNPSKRRKEKVLIVEIRLDASEGRKVLPHDVISKVSKREAGHDKKQSDGQNAVALYIEIEEARCTKIQSAPG